MRLSFKRLLFVILYFSFSILSFAQEAEVTTITISNARQTDYKKDEETDNDLILLEGEVELSVQKGSTVSQIKADKVTYDRKTQMLYAQGQVQITTKSDSEGEQSITAGSLIMNTSTLEGVFDGGKVIQTQSDAINLPSGSTLVVFSDIFGKGDNNSIVFKNSSLTFCDDENPHWHIDASRTWLLPGGEFAFFNALLYVGPVPVLYFPAFYYPKDELIFNPVFGYRNREGYYFQTTTYLFGRKPLESSKKSSDSSDSLKAIYNFMKSSTLKEQEQQGLILHNLDKPYSGDTTHYVKFMADWYSNLGGMVGVDGKLVPKKLNFISSVDFNLSLGFSNVLYSVAGNYIPFNSQMQKENFETNFLGLNLPFRYKANLNLNINKPFTISLSLPIYSDPYFSSDFENRSESLDWFTMLSTFGNEDAVTRNAISSLTWKLSSSYSFNVKDNLRPYISNASLSGSSLVNISAKNNFYIPSSVTPVSIEGSLSGTLVSYPNNKKFVAQTFPLELNPPAEFVQKSQETQNNEDDSQQESEKNEDEKLEPFFVELNTNSKSYQLPEGLRYNLSYSFAPSFITQISYASEKINKVDDFDWDNPKSWMYTLKTPLNLKSNLSYGKNLITLDNTISYSPVWQRHPSTNGYEPGSSELDSLIVSDYKSESQNILSTNSLSVRPLINIPSLSSSYITYNSNLYIFRKTFTGTAQDPSWEYFGPDWTDSDSVTVHNFNINISANQMDNKFSQSFTFTTSLYPQLPKLQGTLNFVFPYVSLNLNGGIQEKSKDDSTWVKNPLNQSLNLSLFDNKLQFNQSFSYNLEDGNPESFRLSLNYKKFSASYVMQYTNGYDFNNGWIAKPNKEFLPYSLSMSYNFGSNTYYYWFNRISVSPGLNTSLVADLVRPTNSYFLFTPSLSFKINEFLTITFSSTSRNSVLYRYVQGMLGHEGRIPGEQNPFIDLIDSFRFDNQALREASGFKLKSLNLTINHELHDWDFNMTMKIEPKLETVNGVSSYNYSPYLSIGITWRPMETMKTQITDDYGKWIME